MSERTTEDLTKALLQKAGYYEKDARLKVELQSSANEIIKKGLRSAGKSGKGGKGFPEFIITSAAHPDIVVVIECKFDTKWHESPDLDRAKDYAVDGALHYAKALALDFNVIAIAVSGHKETALKVTTYLHRKGDAAPALFSSRDGTPRKGVLKYADYVDSLWYDEGVAKVRETGLLAYARKLHEDMRDRAKLTEAQKPLLVSAILLALRNNVFRKTFESLDIALLPDELLEAIGKVFRADAIDSTKAEHMLNVYSFIGHHPELRNPIEKGGSTSPLSVILQGISKQVAPFVAAEMGVDVVGQFYGEFLRYSGGDQQGLGIVLTPRHVTELFVDLADVSVKSVLLDTCTGTSGFLIAGMRRMLDGASPEEKESIKKNQLVGVEQQAHMFTLAASNMILRGDGKANLHLGSCFDDDITAKVKSKKPTVGLINPPYGQKTPGLQEVNFIEHMLDCLEPNSVGIAIVPLSVAIAPCKGRESLLQAHTLEAVMSMPDELFNPVGTITCIMVFRAHKPHNPKKKTWFGYWKDDGFVKTKTDGRTDKKGLWPAIRSRWLQQFRDGSEVPGQCIKASVTADDEWCAEAYLATDYSIVTEAVFEADVRKFLVHQLLTSDTQLSGANP